MPSRTTRPSSGCSSTSATSSPQGLGRRGAPQSVKTGRTNDDVKAARDALWLSEAPAAAAEIDLSRARLAPMPSRIEPMLRDARFQAVQRPALAVRDQVGRLPRTGRRPGQAGQAPDPQPPRRRDLLPEAPRAAHLDLGVGGDRGRGGRRARRRRPAGLRAPPGAARAEGRGRASCTRRSICCTWTAGRCWTCRSRIASGCSRASSGASAGPLRRPRRGRRAGLPCRCREPGSRRRRRQAPNLALRARQALVGLAQAQDPARAGVRDRWLDAGGGECPRARGGRGRRL